MFHKQEWDVNIKMLLEQQPTQVKKLETDLKRIEHGTAFDFAKASVERKHIRTIHVSQQRLFKNADLFISQ